MTQVYLMVYIALFIFTALWLSTTKVFKTTVPELYKKYTPTYIRIWVVIVFEAAIVLCIVHIPLIYHLLNNGSIDLIEGFKTMYGPTDIMGYLSGIMATSMAAYMVNLKLLKLNPLNWFITVIPALLILLFAAPSFFLSPKTWESQSDFNNNYFLWLFFFAILSWLVSMYCSRTSHIINDSTSEQKQLNNKVSAP